MGTSRQDALTLAAKINARLAEGVPTALAFRPIPLRKLIAKWIDHHEYVRRSSLAAVQCYRTAAEHLARFVVSAGSGLRADRFTPALAAEFVRYLRTTKP